MMEYSPSDGEAFLVVQSIVQFSLVFSSVNLDKLGEINPRQLKMGKVVRYNPKFYLVKLYEDILSSSGVLLYTSLDLQNWVY